jgi:hypothetical protein
MILGFVGKIFYDIVIDIIFMGTIGGGWLGACASIDLIGDSLNIG